MKDLKNYRDSLGCIANRDQFSLKFDYGDCAQRDGTYLICKWLTEQNKPVGIEYVEMMWGHELRAGVFCRRIDQNWWGLETTMSRDQIKPLIIAMGFFGDTTRLFKLFIQFLLRAFFCQNTRGNWDDTATKLPDWAGPDVWANIIRSRRAYILWPLLLLCDLFIFANSLTRIYYSRKNYDDVGDDLNHCLDLVQAYHRLPTPVSWAARKLYFKFRAGYYPSTMGMIRTNGGGPQYAWDWYFRQNEAPPMNDVIRPILESMK